MLEGTGLTDDMDGRILVITNGVSTNVVPLVNAKGLFAIKKDGTVIYNDRGFDDVPNNAEFDPARHRGTDQPQQQVTIVKAAGGGSRSIKTPSAVLAIR